MHMVHYSKPAQQRHVIRIMILVPIYGAESWLVLASPSHMIFLETMREW